MTQKKARNSIGLYPQLKSHLILGKDHGVTNEPGCRNNWHIHHADNGGGQLLICIYGKGWYQEWGKEARELYPGDVVNIPANVKHWHGAAKDNWFQHIAQEIWLFRVECG